MLNSIITCPNILGAAGIAALLASKWLWAALAAQLGISAMNRHKEQNTMKDVSMAELDFKKQELASKGVAADKVRKFMRESMLEERDWKKQDLATAFKYGTMKEDRAFEHDTTMASKAYAHEDKMIDKRMRNELIAKRLGEQGATQRAIIQAMSSLDTRNPLQEQADRLSLNPKLIPLDMLIE